MNENEHTQQDWFEQRRRWLGHVGMGVGAIALKLLLSQEQLRAEPPILKDKPHRDLTPRAFSYGSDRSETRVDQIPRYRLPR
jgi:hypothetical protein